ncbi:MAG: glycoside hydrolase family 36 protein [Blastochloris sp.]|nr:glycoside hydrolase family 36 protein [Blastochloris sp.]
MPFLSLFEHQLGDMTARYITAEHEPTKIGLLLFPTSKKSDNLTPREYLNTPAALSLPKSWQPVRAWQIDPLVHVHVRGQITPSIFSQGRSLRNGPATHALHFIHQEKKVEAGSTIIKTFLKADYGLECVHELRHKAGEKILHIRSHLRNSGNTPLTIELLSSFSLGGITPFDSEDAPNRLHVHRFRSSWSAEGRHEERSIEELHLERSWGDFGVQAERFGAVGSMPVNGFFPFVGLEDRTARVTWAAQIAHPGSWQMEVYRRADHVALSGGLADRELGHWYKTLAPAENFSSPEALITVAKGGVTEACGRLTHFLSSNLSHVPQSELELPIIFNEWCTSWGNPTHENLIALADRLQGSGVKYLVIDDGWAERPGNGIQQNGDWNLNTKAFPQGLRATADAIRARGLIPGIWFEFEVVNPGSQAWEETSHQLHRDGQPLQVGSRRFWDFRDPWVHDYLTKKVTRLLSDNNLGYLKVDYNDTIGIGCDSAPQFDGNLVSLGEGLRQHLGGVQQFFRSLSQALPELVIENCSSGGHRLEPSMMSLTSMSSFSDAHETPDIPILAANLLQLIPAQQNQIWAVLHQADSLQRLCYSLSSTFLGRLCLSGEVHELSAEQWAFVCQAMNLYLEARPFLTQGIFKRYGLMGASYQHPEGWQAVLAQTDVPSKIMVVWHCFAQCPSYLVIPLPEGSPWNVTKELHDISSDAEVKNSNLILINCRPWSGGVLFLNQ